MTLNIHFASFRETNSRVFLVKRKKVVWSPWKLCMCLLHCKFSFCCRLHWMPHIKVRNTSILKTKFVLLIKLQKFQNITRRKYLTYLQITFILKFVGVFDQSIQRKNEVVRVEKKVFSLSLLFTEKRWSCHGRLCYACAVYSIYFSSASSGVSPCKLRITFAKLKSENWP